MVKSNADYRGTFSLYIKSMELIAEFDQYFCYFLILIYFSVFSYTRYEAEV